MSIHSYTVDAQLVDEINRLCDHQIPFYAYGDNQAACEMASRLAAIAEMLPTPDATKSEGVKPCS